MAKKSSGKKVEPYGMLHPAVGNGGPMFLRQSVGEMKDEDDNVVYELTANVSDLSPIIEHKGTGKRFTLSWHDILAMAQAAGIDKDD